jgi:hypothetical protein
MANGKLVNTMKMDLLLNDASGNLEFDPCGNSKYD